MLQGFQKLRTQLQQLLMAMPSAHQMSVLQHEMFQQTSKQVQRCGWQADLALNWCSLMQRVRPLLLGQQQLQPAHVSELLALMQQVAAGLWQWEASLQQVSAYLSTEVQRVEAATAAAQQQLERQQDMQQAQARLHHEQQQRDSKARIQHQRLQEFATRLAQCRTQCCSWEEQRTQQQWLAAQESDLQRQRQDYAERAHVWEQYAAGQRHAIQQMQQQLQHMEVELQRLQQEELGNLLRQQHCVEEHKQVLGNWCQALLHLLRLAHGALQQVQQPELAKQAADLLQSWREQMDWKVDTTAPQGKEQAEGYGYYQ